MPIQIPDVSANITLRNVRVKGMPEILIQTWETGKRYQTGQHMVGAALWDNYNLIFVSNDFGISPSNPIDSDAALMEILGWLTLKPGDTDEEFFSNYTETQLNWCQSNVASELSLIVYDFNNNDGTDLKDKELFLDI